MLTVLGRATSVNVQRVMWAIAELGLECRRVDLGGSFGGLDTDAFAAKNPNRLIPVLETDDGVVMWESPAIVRWLALNEPARQLWPAEGQPAASADMWAEWAANSLGRPLTGLFVSVVRTPPAQRDWATISARATEVHRTLAMAEQMLGTRQWLAGDTFTIADINLGVWLYRYHTLEVERPELPALAAYYMRLTERPAYAEHVMVDYAGLFARD